jgi:hypothetical protein
MDVWDFRFSRRRVLRWLSSAASETSVNFYQTTTQKKAIYKWKKAEQETDVLETSVKTKALTLLPGFELRPSNYHNL